MIFRINKCFFLFFLVMVVNNPEWLELTKEVESFMVNGLIMSNQTNAPIVNPQSVPRQGNNEWSSTLTANSQGPTVKVQNVPTAVANNNNHARAVLISKQNSHPFDVCLYKYTTFSLNNNDNIFF